MPITLSPDEYAAAWRLITDSTWHDKNIEEVLVSKVLPGLRERPTLLDVGAGSGIVARRLAPHFGRITLVEQNPSQIEPNREELKRAGVRIFDGPFGEFDDPERYDVVLCSHVLYHVPRARWTDFIGRMLSFVRPGGVCVVVLVGGPTAGHGRYTTHHAMRQDFTDAAVNSQMLTGELGAMGLAYTVVSTENPWSTSTLDDMYAVCRFVVYEDCLTPEQLEQMSERQLMTLELRIREHAQDCPRVGGRYQLEMEDSIVLVPRPR
ncbi:class I SAM-dependent methyltransferase [Streptomyces sp. PTM05]|uniref:Class I SAM-dependent methyltransferase n=1 Tax=Streptantibioticus parmotrematis TaxID=2873249 RepID=A0ABS7QWG4_9ACTN|nr:class I SAM-dependent methyltransferase [Streptantibioticus parmotrematis]MBY8887014.1 class I SAM-dependent methyltransferase [Streptantibioticus parmotrematis]